MYGLRTVPLLLSWMPGVILSICPYSVCMASAQSHSSCPGCRVSFSVSVLILYVWTLHSPTSPVLDAGCNSQYLPLFCMYGLCTVPLLLSCMPGVILDVLYVWTLHSPTSPVLDAGFNSRYLSLLCMYGLCTVPLLLSCIPGVILGICPYSVCMDSAQSPLLLSCIPGVILGICPYSVCMDSAQSHISCPVCRV
ncbi:unnamed protein product [Staurois parvus]|uniref:Seven transmembrane helix receptor n=1 Tax=Staurois parvus TaxID=386267 RepID=A0ABN9ESN9_9NEOB|nr:unnamed protein product [Staurois parvus]